MEEAKAQGLDGGSPKPKAAVEGRAWPVLKASPHLTPSATPRRQHSSLPHSLSLPLRFLPSPSHCASGPHSQAEPMSSLTLSEGPIAAHRPLLKQYCQFS